MHWTITDFVFAAILLGGAALLLAWAMRGRARLSYKAGAVTAIVAGLMLVWLNAAVGIVGAADNDANMVFFAVPVLAAIGAITARGRAGGMARAMVAAAGAQLLATIGAIALNASESGLIWRPDVLVISGFFFLLWVVSGLLFGAARARQASASSSSTS